MQILHPVFEYIKQYWRLDLSQLAHSPFDLEECFTLLELQLGDLDPAKDGQQMARLQAVRSGLVHYLAEVLGEFEHTWDTAVFEVFAGALLKQQPTVITFNYDVLLESMIARASGMTGHHEDLPAAPDRYMARVPQLPAGDLAPRILNELAWDEAARQGPVEFPDEIMAQSFYTWNPRRAYGIRFDEVQLERAGSTFSVRGDRFYAAPGCTLYDWRILKLHGSLNWFRYLPWRMEKFGEIVPDENGSTGLLLYTSPWWTLAESIYNDNLFVYHGYLVNPVIVPPVLYKDRWYVEPLASLRTQAYDALRTCRRLVFIGYSLPRTDFPNRRLFMEGVEGRTLDELVVVNPNGDVVRRLQTLCPAKTNLVCGNLETFIRLGELGCRRS